MTPQPSRRRVFITGGTGYMGRHFIPELLKRGHQVRALVRPGSNHKLSPDCTVVVGNALDSSTFAAFVPECETLVHLVGVSKPHPSKAAEFRAIDLPSVRASVAAAAKAAVHHFVYVSVAQPAPVMKAYVEVRAECEALIRQAGLNATFLRPWYVLGPGHAWPYLLVPFYWAAQRWPATRDTARRLGLVTLKQMIHALTWAVENPCSGVRIMDVPQIRTF